MVDILLVRTPVRPDSQPLTVTVIIPFHRNLGQLRRSLPAVCRSMPEAEILVAADGAMDDCQGLAAECNARVIVLAERSGPAVARNRAAAVARGDLLVFVDADVVVAPDAIPGLCRLLEQDRNLAGVFGSYDESPAESNFMSQYKNLSHCYIHQIGSREAGTFWAGLGAIRSTVFREVGGFDERFQRPSVEDIELGYRVRRAGGRLRLAPEFRGCHLKRWTLWGSVVTDITARGIPWAQLIRKFQALTNDLNTRVELRLSVALAYVLLFASAALLATRWAAPVAAAALAAIVLLNYAYYAWFARTRGVWFALRVVPAHVLHHLCNGVSFVVGTTLFLASQSGVIMPGAISPAIWRPQQVAAGRGAMSSDLDYV